MDNNAMNKVTCGIAKDLIPLYSEGLCGEESKKALENHLAECESCRRLLELPVEQEQPAPVPEEKNIFRKLNRKMKRGKLLIIALSVVLVLVVGAVGFLSVGQIVKSEGMVSFETIAQSIEARKVVGYIVNKDFTSYVNSIYDNKFFFMAENVTSEKKNEKSADELLQAYEASFGRAKVKNIDIVSSYSLLPEPKAVMILTNCKIKYDDGSVLELELVKNYDNRFMTSALGFSCDNSDAARKFVSCFNLFSSKSGANDFLNKNVLERIFTRPKSAGNRNLS
ncbi:MAG: zf-HC2 domain-containing protein, partial [Oscillospiraceae bacterium]